MGFLDFGKKKRNYACWQNHHNQCKNVNDKCSCNCHEGSIGKGLCHICNGSNMELFLHNAVTCCKKCKKDLNTMLTKRRRRQSKST